MNEDERPVVQRRYRVDGHRAVLGAICAAVAAGCAPGGDHAEGNAAETVRSSSLTPGQIDPIRVQAIFASDDDGNFAPTVTPAQVRADLNMASQIWGPASVRFEFDPSTDVTYVNSSLLSHSCEPGGPLGTPTAPPCSAVANNAERNRVAQTYPGKLVVYYHAGQQPILSGGTYQFLPKTQNFSGREHSFVSMMGNDVCPVAACQGLAHEIGHYLHANHTHDDGAFYWTLSDAQNAIKAYVESNALPKNRGYDLFDGDHLPSTPPDPGLGAMPIS